MVGYDHSYECYCVKLYALGDKEKDEELIAVREKNVRFDGETVDDTIKLIKKWA